MSIFCIAHSHFSSIRSHVSEVRPVRHSHLYHHNELLATYKRFFAENDANLSALKTDQLVQSFVGECCNLIMGGIKKILNEHDIGITDQFSEVVLPIHCSWSKEKAQKIFDGYSTEDWHLLHKEHQIEGRTAILVNKWSRAIQNLPTTNLNLENLDKQEEIEFFF